jgi:hypothetical protein
VADTWYPEGGKLLAATYERLSAARGHDEGGWLPAGAAIGGGRPELILTASQHAELGCRYIHDTYGDDADPAAA